MTSRLWKVGAIFGVSAVMAGTMFLTPVVAQTDGTPFQVDSFTQIQIEGGGHAIITIGSPAAVNVSGPEAEISNLQVQVWFNTLEIEPNDDDNGGASSELVYHITAPSLSQIELEGSVTAEIAGLTTDSLQISVEDSAGLQIANLVAGRLEAQIEGSATVTLSGKADSQQIENEDNSTYDAIQLDSATANVEAEGSSHSKIRFSGSLSGQAEDSAVVDYMTESGSVSVSTQDSARLNALPFEALTA